MNPHMHNLECGENRRFPIFLLLHFLLPAGRKHCSGQVKERKSESGDSRFV